APTTAGRSSSIVSTRKTPSSTASAVPCPPLRCGSVTATPRERFEPTRADHLLILAVLQHRPERQVDRRGVEMLDAEQVERGQPVDRLGDARRLLDVALAHPRDRVGHLYGERLRRT